MKAIRSILTSVSATFLVCACGSAPTAPPTSANASPSGTSGATTPAVVPARAETSVASPSAPTVVPTVEDKFDRAEKAPHVDPNERGEHIVLTPLVSKGTARASFPKPTISDHDCLKELPFTGNHQADYQALVDKCGATTGLLEYTKAHEGRLHAKKDVRDHFRISVMKGFCYRYFAVADDGIKDIDIIVLRKGALIATDRTEQPIAIIDSDKLWCVDEDEDLEFSVEIDGRGAGGYTFGVWTRPK